MRRLLAAAIALGALTFAGAAQASPPCGPNVHFAGYPHHQFDRGCWRQPTVRYYAPPVVYPAPVLYAPQPACGPVAYGSYYQPLNNVSLFGRNFGVQFNW
jgi:hypothetical protein